MTYPLFEQPGPGVQSAGSLFLLSGVRVGGGGGEGRGLSFSGARGLIPQLICAYKSGLTIRSVSSVRF